MQSALPRFPVEWILAYRRESCLSQSYISTFGTSPQSPICRHLIPMPGITAGMGFQRDYIGISKISAYVEKRLLSKELTLPVFIELQNIVCRKGYMVNSAYVHYNSGNSSRMILEGCAVKKSSAGGEGVWQRFGFCKVCLKTLRESAGRFRKALYLEMLKYWYIMLHLWYRKMCWFAIYF